MADIAEVNSFEFKNESHVLKNTIIDEESKTSASRVNHLTFQLVFEIETGVKIRSLDTTIELGSGYGEMTLHLRRINPPLR